MSSEAEDLSLISELISKDLQLVPYGAWNTKLCKSKTKIEDSIMSFKLYGKGIEEVHRAGSLAEGTTVEASDSDLMAQLSGIEVLKSRNACVNVERDIIYVVSDSSKCTPGYVRLMPREHSKVMYHPQIKVDFCHILQPMPDGSYLSSEWFRYLMLSLMPDEDRHPDFPFKKGVQHGPCMMLTYEHYYKDTTRKQNIVTEYDTAYALTYRGWPDEANEWTTRERKFDWPTPATVRKISELGCHVVPVGDSSSASCSLEWRQSFLLCEKELIWNFNDTQIQCYVIMKRLIKKYIDRFVPDQISSYNLKTVIFWLSEEQGLNAWIPENLLQRLKDCLTRLSQSVERRNLPHYFVKKANLFRNRFLTPHDKMVTTDKLRNVTDNIVTSTMDAGLPPNSNIYKLWTVSGKQLDMFQSKAVKIGELSEKYMTSLLRTQKIELHLAVLGILKIYTSNFNSDQVIDDILLFLNRNDLEVHEAVATRVRHYLHIRKGLEHLQRAKQSTDETERIKLQGIALSEIEKGSKLDMLSAPLYLATYYMSISDFPKCISVIEDCLANLPSKLVYAGYCSSSQFMEIENGKLLNRAGFDISPGEINALKGTFDVLFAREDYSVVPRSLTFECALLPEYGEKYVAIHPFVYAYHLLHVAKVMDLDGPCQQTKEVLKYLDDLLKSFGSPRTFHAVNAVGVSYLFEKDNEKALFNFILSLGLTFTMPMVRNGAAWWLAIIIYKNVFSSTKTYSEAETESKNLYR